MNYPTLMRTAIVAAALGTGCVIAQTTTPAPTTSEPPIVSDVGPRPAEDRSSTGAIVLDNSLVRAQRDNAFERASSRSGVATVGRGTVRGLQQSRAEADLAQSREADRLARP